MKGVEGRKLHRLHAAPASGKGGNSVDIADVRWRGDGGAPHEKRDMARRIAVCWNVCEGLPTEALESGAVRDFYAAALELADAAAAHPELAELVAKLRRADAAHNIDRTGGRLHDCAKCLPEADDLTADGDA